MKKIQLMVCAALALFVLGCGSDKKQEQLAQAVAIESADECHLCGMIISRFPGPKGEAYQDGAQQIKKFCSTRDMLTWALDPENKSSLREIFVHDMGQTSWDSPSDEQFIDGRTAWYVAGTSRMGAMGPAIVSFSDKALAEQFAKHYGGELYRFEQLTLELLSQTSMQHMNGHGGGHQMKHGEMAHDKPASDEKTSQHKMSHGEMQHTEKMKH